MVNGGIAIAALGCLALHAAGDTALAIYRLTGRLERPVPYDADLEGFVEPAEDGSWVARVADGERVYVSGRIELGKAADERWADVPEHLRPALARMARNVDAAPDGPFLVDRAPEVTHTCFGCARSRELGGLWLPEQTVGEDGNVAWSALDVSDEFDDGDGTLAAAIAAAATDCPTGVSFGTDEHFWTRLADDGKVAITGTLDYRWLRPVPLRGPDFRVLGTPLSFEGRKMLGTGALIDATRTPYVVSEGTWLTIPMPDSP
jgi:hypothetical protein